MMPSIIKPYNDNDRIMNLATTTSAPENAAATNAKHNNQNIKSLMQSLTDYQSTYSNTGTSPKAPKNNLSAVSGKLFKGNGTRVRIDNYQRDKHYFFIHPQTISNTQKVTYVKLVASLRLLKN